MDLMALVTRPSARLSERRTSPTRREETVTAARVATAPGPETGQEDQDPEEEAMTTVAVDGSTGSGLVAGNRLALRSATETIFAPASNRKESLWTPWFQFVRNGFLYSR
jgi:hypothetical protein